MGWDAAADMVSNNPVYGGFSQTQQLNALRFVGLL
jgi:hypothetical protein